MSRAAKMTESLGKVQRKKVASSITLAHHKRWALLAEKLKLRKQETLEAAIDALCKAEGIPLD